MGVEEESVAQKLVYGGVPVPEKVAQPFTRTTLMTIGPDPVDTRR